MMAGAIFDEKDLRFNFSKALSVSKFDPSGRSGSECISSIDFIVELSNYILFVEVKDPDHPRATDEAREQFLSELKSLKKARTLAQNCRDSFFYENAGGRVNKPVVFIAIVELSSIPLSDMTPSDDELRKCLFIDKHPKNTDNEKIVKNSMIMNVATWNQKFSDFPIERISAASN